MEVLKEIAEREYRFFERLQPTNSECKREKTFKFMRISRFYLYSLETLLSYLNDLIEAEKEGRNPLYEKYACMEGRLEISEDKRGLIERIVQIEKSWIEELHGKYPHAIENKPEFQRYLACELSTFSVQTLERYLEDVERAKEAGKNLALESYLYTFSRLGYSSLEDVEEKFKKRTLQK